MPQRAGVLFSITPPPNKNTKDYKNPRIKIDGMNINHSKPPLQS